MNRITLFLMSFFLTHQASAVLGPEFLSSERPHSICAIEFYRDGILDEVCSAVMIGEKKLLTADHCLPGLPERDHKLICRAKEGVVTSRIKKVIGNEKADRERMIYDEWARTNDNGLLEIEDDLPVPSLEFIHSKEELSALISRAQTCGIFGHGGFRHTLREKGLSTNAIIIPEQIILERDLIRLNGFKGRASGLVEPGDSGGSLACLDSLDGRWKHIAQTSARTMSGVSIFAPTYTISSQLKAIGVQSISPRFERIKLALKAQDQEHELLNCLDQECRYQKTERLKEKLAAGEKLQVKVSPYSLIELDQREEMILLDSNRDSERLLTTPNPFTTVEHSYNRFILKSIEGDIATGDFQRFGYSEYFLCIENILCDGGLYKNVRVKLSDLLL